MDSKEMRLKYVDNIQWWLKNVENLDRIEIQPDQSVKQIPHRLKEDCITKCMNSNPVIDKTFHRRETKNMKKKPNPSQNTEAPKKLKRKHSNLEIDSSVKKKRRLIKRDEPEDQILDAKGSFETNKKQRTSRYLANEKLLEQRLVLKKNEKLGDMNSSSSSDEEVDNSLSISQQYCDKNTSQLENCKTIKKRNYQLLKLRNKRRSQTKHQTKLQTKGKRKLNQNFIEEPDKSHTSADLSISFDSKKHTESVKKQLSVQEDKELAKQEKPFVVKDENLLKGDGDLNLPVLQTNDTNYNLNPKTKDQIKTEKIGV